MSRESNQFNDSFKYSSMYSCVSSSIICQHLSRASVEQVTSYIYLHQWGWAAMTYYYFVVCGNHIPLPISATLLHSPNLAAEGFRFSDFINLRLFSTSKPYWHIIGESRLMRPVGICNISKGTVLCIEPLRQASCCFHWRFYRDGLGIPTRPDHRVRFDPGKQRNYVFMPRLDQSQSKKARGTRWLEIKSVNPWCDRPRFFHFKRGLRHLLHISRKSRMQHGPISI